jgi:hypothetical protein
LYRVREVTPGTILFGELGTRLRVSYFFNPCDETKLPSAEQYEKVICFERTAIDRVEAWKLGVLALVKTSLGIVRYSLYVKDASAAGDVVHASARVLMGRGPLVLDFAPLDDPQWEEYRSFMAAISGDKGLRFGELWRHGADADLRALVCWSDAKMLRSMV